jgi:two-component system response regulator NreC
VPRARVLLVDDFPRFIAAMQRLLVQHGYDIVGSAADGVQAIGEAVRLQPDVVLLDLFMPKMNGIDACRELTRLHPDARVIVLSAEADPDLRQAALDAGACAFVDKQAIGTDLLPAIRAACDTQYV